MLSDVSEKTIYVDISLICLDEIHQPKLFVSARYVPKHFWVTRAPIFSRLMSSLTKEFIHMLNIHSHKRHCATICISTGRYILPFIFNKSNGYSPACSTINLACSVCYVNSFFVCLRLLNFCLIC